MKNILILASDTPAGGDGRVGDLFDSALLEVVRALDVSSGVATVLVPWSDELAPLIAVASVDTAPSFDAESAAEEGTQSSLIPYRPQGALNERSRQFLAASHLSLSGRSPLSFEAAIKQHPPTEVIVLSPMLSRKDEVAVLREAPGFKNARLLMFGSLTSRDQVAAVMERDSERVEDLEHRIRPIDGEARRPSEEEAKLEPFIPFGLLIQDAFGEILPDVPMPSSRRDRR